MAFLFLPSPSFSSMPVSKASVGSGGFWAAEDFASVLISHICTHSWSPQPPRKVPDHLLAAHRAVGGEHLLWGMVPAGGNSVFCARGGSCWHTWWRTQMKLNALFLVRRGFMCALLPALTSICFVSCCAGSPTSKLSSVCQASHGTASPVSKTHGSSFGASAVKVMSSLGVYFPFKVQLSIKWDFLALKILHFRQVPWIVISCEGFTVSNRWSHRRTWWLCKMIVSLHAALIRLATYLLKALLFYFSARKSMEGIAPPNVVSFKKALL